MNPFWNYCCRFLLLTGLSCALVNWSWAEPPVKSLDDQLLDDGPKLPTNPAVKPSTQPAVPATNEPLVPKSLKLDIDPSKPNFQSPNPLTRIAGKMEQVERRLNAGVNDSIIVMQMDIAADLEKLLQGCQGQCSSSSTSQKPSASGQQNKPGNSPQNPNPQQNAKQQPTQTQPSSQSGQGAKAAGNGQGNDKSTAPNATTRQVLEKSWGHLPQREREQILEAAGEGFIPQYERSSQQYFQRLTQE